MSNAMNSDGAGEGVPRKRQGETFTAWWARLSAREVVALHAATTYIGIGPQSFFDSYLKATEDEDH